MFVEKLLNVGCSTVLNLEIFNHQIIANLLQNETEIENLSNTYENSVYFEQIDGFFREKIEFFQNR